MERKRYLQAIHPAARKCQGIRVLRRTAVCHNLPHYGHLLAGIIKDIVPRYWTMRGFKVLRRFGWDTHGFRSRWK